jgi:hypothetical protein
MMCGLLRKKTKNTHFILGVKAKVELKLSIPIGAITEIIPKGFTLGVKEKNLRMQSLLSHGGLTFRI